MIVTLFGRLLCEVAPRPLWNFLYRGGVQGFLAVRRYRRRLARGRVAPPFVFLSISNRCNLRCQGCWVDVDGPPRTLSTESMDRIIGECKRAGSRFFGLLGGEPLLHQGLFAILKRHRDCYFQLFTNGTLIDAQTASGLRALGNVTPLISLEGFARVSDERRGGNDVYAKALAAIDHCRRERLVIGVASSICASNFDELVDDAFLRDLIRRGVHYMWYYIYRPAGAEPHPELALDREQIRRLRRFLVEQRSRHPLVLVDAYWDAEGEALCPAAVGLSHHIGPGGDIEPCPPIQLAVDHVDDGPVPRTLENSAFLQAFRREATEKARGCILLENPQALQAFARRHGARDTSGRDFVSELACMHCHPGHDLGQEAIPERHRAYRWLKRYAFLGFGAYG